MATRALPQPRQHTATELGSFLRHVDYLLLAAVGCLTAYVLLIIVFPLAENVRGSQRWITFHSFNFQPSELGKLLLIIFLAAFIADRGRRIGEWWVLWAFLGLAAVPILLVSAVVELLVWPDLLRVASPLV